MTSRLAWYFQAKRIAQGLSTETLARQVGYRNVRKGVRRILRFSSTPLPRHAASISPRPSASTITSS